MPFGPEILIMSIILLLVGGFVAGGILLADSKNKETGVRNKGMMIAGWICLGVSSLITTALLLYLLQFFWSSISVVLLLLSPFIILGGFIGFMVAGIVNLINGIRRKNTTQIVFGAVFITIDVLIVIGIVVLIGTFTANYTRPISLM